MLKAAPIDEYRHLLYTGKLDEGLCLTSSFKRSDELAYFHWYMRVEDARPSTGFVVLLESGLLVYAYYGNRDKRYVENVVIKNSNYKYIGYGPIHSEYTVKK